LTAAVTLSGVGKVYPDGTRALVDLDLRVEPGELMVIVGPSGCGKTTLLRLTAGLEGITTGELRIGDRVMNSVDPRERDVAMVFQNYALYPHMSVFENLAFPLRARGLKKAEIRARVERTAALLDVDGLLRRKPRALSGGQRQRVAMGRAIVREPEVFLMDEPLSNLDAKLRGEMRAEITRLQRELGVTTMYVTHDQLEAMTMGTRITVLRDGALQQCDTPQTVYDDPSNAFVASFIGSPTMNLLPARIEREGDGLACVLGERRLALGVNGSTAALARYASREVTVGIRPEHLKLATDEACLLRGRASFVELLGPERLVNVELPQQGVVTARVEAERAVAAGDVVDLAVNARRLRFFDRETGQAIR
jgi:multiple sugar transport system ATP-binding protein